MIDFQSPRYLVADPLSGAATSEHKCLFIGVREQEVYYVNCLAAINQLLCTLGQATLSAAA